MRYLNGAIMLMRVATWLGCLAFILGCVPLWTASGAGAISRRVLGTAVIGGMLAASLLAIFLIPVSFDLVQRIAHRGKKRLGPAHAPVIAPSHGD